MHFVYNIDWSAEWMFAFIIIIIKGIYRAQDRPKATSALAAELSTVHMSTVNILSTVKQKCLQLCSESLNRNMDRRNEHLFSSSEMCKLIVLVMLKSIKIWSIFYQTKN